MAQRDISKSEHGDVASDLRSRLVFANDLLLLATSVTALQPALYEGLGLDLVCQYPHAYSPALTAVMVPGGHDADTFRKVVLDNFDMSLGAGLNKLKGKAFRIGHLGHLNDLTLMGALAGIEMSLDIAKMPHRAGGVAVAMEVLKGRDAAPMLTAVAA